MTQPDTHFSLQLLPGMLRLAPVHQQAGQQPDNLCGPYWASLLLRSRGFAVSAEEVAQRAGSVLPVGDPKLWLPNGATPRQDYHLPIPETDCLADAGTSAQGIIEAIDHLSAGAYCCLPLQTSWTAAHVWQVMELCQAHPDWEIVPLCNLRTGHLWGSQLGMSEAIAYLNNQPIQPTAADWNVGHFLVLAGWINGQRNSLIWVCDTYPQFGWQGYHLQSADTIANALNRDDGYSGGILLFVAASHRVEVEREVAAIGFRLECWDNGSPLPQLKSAASHE
jgi:hypothetical protein